MIEFCYSALEKTQCQVENVRCNSASPKQKQCASLVLIKFDARKFIDASNNLCEDLMSTTWYEDNDDIF